MEHLTSILAPGVSGGIKKTNPSKFKCPWGSQQNVEAST